MRSAPRSEMYALKFYLPETEHFPRASASVRFNTRATLKQLTGLGVSLARELKINCQVCHLYENCTLKELIS